MTGIRTGGRRREADLLVRRIWTFGTRLEVVYGHSARRGQGSPRPGFGEARSIL
jgi:hypothetical protein